MVGLLRFWFASGWHRHRSNAATMGIGHRGEWNRPRVRARIWLCLWLLLPVSARSLEVGQMSPPYQARLLDGQTVTPAQTRGKVVLIHFWATWCVPCRTEMPALERYYQKHRAQGLEILMVSMDDEGDLPKMRQMMEKYSYPGAWYRQSDFKQFGRIWRIPISFVIDRTGVLRQDSWDGGEAGLDEGTLEQIVTPLLAGS